jgi:8-oxo-dGTP pyrophosphatase MutT (NUDIX family)
MTTDIQTWSAWHQQAPRKSVAVGAVVQKDVALLFVRHTYGVLRGQWSFPTGFAEPSESPEMTALREVQEEGGITATVDGLLTLCTVNWEGDIQLYLVWLCQHIGGEPKPDGEEVDRAAYLSEVDLEGFHEPIVPFSRWLAARVFQQRHQFLQPVDMTVIAPYLGTAFA